MVGQHELRMVEEHRSLDQLCQLSDVSWIVPRWRRRAAAMKLEEKSKMLVRVGTRSTL
jgi:hypothetical protein